MIFLRQGATAQRRNAEWYFPLRLCALAVPSPNFVAFCEDFPGARTALSASFFRRPSNTRTRLSALRWLRLRRAVPLR